ncbi:MAG: sensor histidine kinase, partial [Planctomycetota bacterium]|nr:sensor histidine kinase [Planctomycetota bacterium]
ELDRTIVNLQTSFDELSGRLPKSERERVHINIEEGLPDISADVRKIQQVLENLVSNALKYSEADKPVRVELRKKGRRVLVEVTDEGMGIRPQDRKHVFEKFFRSEDARLAGKEGTGLGLSITYEIVRLHGGQLGFKSRRGKGTTFTLELPIG